MEMQMNGRKINQIPGKKKEKEEDRDTYGLENAVRSIALQSPQASSSPNADGSEGAQVFWDSAFGLVEKLSEGLGSRARVLGKSAQARRDLNEELEILADGEKLEVVVEAEDVDAAAGAAGVKDHGIRGLGRQLAVVAIGGEGGGQLAASAAAGHDVEDHGEEEERDRDDEEDAPVSVHFVGEGVVLGIAHADSSSAGTLEHLVVGVVG